ncbi:MAG: HAMP domain-containing sensor histidine kinase, partial [Candidatus Omnitrophica bacterium]|nr:HAMP domain-containing sensor histidine kinase [Candidatus Omnitrophota bacterium]
TGLYALQRISRAVSTTLEDHQIFKMIEANHLEELGFEKTLVFLYDEKQSIFAPYLHINYTQEGLEKVGAKVNQDKNFYLDLIHSQKTVSSISLKNTEKIKEINFLFGSIYTIISPILPKEGNRGFIFMGTEDTDMTPNEGDEEFITILANQLSAALDNARLFEKTWRAQHDLERKVEERTRELRTLLEEVKNISKRKTDFISSVSHELRTPLTSIKGYASILLAGKLGNVPDEIKERLEKINRHSDELTHMVNDLLDISRIESGKVAMKREPQDLNYIVKTVLDLLSVQLKDKDITTPADIKPEAATVMADRNQLERVFINIIGNAIKFTPEKGKISISARKLENLVQVDITDTGCGIPTGEQEKIFEEFYRVENQINETVKGTGLGLALVKHIIEAHGGKIWAKGSPGAGSTFSFTLPQ